MNNLSSPRNNRHSRRDADRSTDSRHPEFDRICTTLSNREPRERVEGFSSQHTATGPVVTKLAKRVKPKPRLAAIASALATVSLCAVVACAIVYRPRSASTDGIPSKADEGIRATSLSSLGNDDGTTQQNLFTYNLGGAHVVLPNPVFGEFHQYVVEAPSIATHDAPSDDDLVVGPSVEVAETAEASAEAKVETIGAKPMRSMLTSIRTRLESIAETANDVVLSQHWGHQEYQESDGQPAANIEDALGDTDAIGDIAESALPDVANPPFYKATELKRAVELARQATTDIESGAWRSEERSEQKRLAREFYIRLSEMGLRALFVDAAAPDAKAGQQLAHDLLAEMGADEDKFKFIGNAAKGWIQWSRRDSNGIVLAGRVTHVLATAGGWEVQIQLPDSNQTVVPLITTSSTQLSHLPLQVGDRVLAMGILIDDPARQLKNYSGPHSKLVWGRPVFGNERLGPNSGDGQLKVGMTRF